jgi:hypothetical protein
MAEPLNPDDFTLVEESENFKQSKIARSNITTEFTLELIESHQALLEKSEKELKAQLRLSQATVDNMFKNHKWLLKLDKEKIHHAWMLKENLDVVEVAQPKLKEVQDQLAQYADLKELLYAKFNFQDVTPSETEGA